MQIESTTLWDFPRQNYGEKPHGNNKYNGVTPAFVIWNLLQRYTKEGDLVVDPMCGSGTTIDVAKELNRRVIGYDLNIVRPDIIKNDARKIPLEDNSVDFFFIDSPYSDNIRYSEDGRCIGKISCENIEFYDELEKVASEGARILKPGKVIAWVIADQWIKKKFTATGFLMWQRLEKYFESIDIVCLTRHNQTSNT
jgi:DNA modification methylase